MRGHIRGRDAANMAVESNSRGPVRIEALPTNDAASVPATTENATAPSRSRGRYGKGLPECGNHPRKMINASRPQLIWRGTERPSVRPLVTLSLTNSSRSYRESSFPRCDRDLRTN